jgi:selenocysteine lyase/cysteine desulfurase
VTGAGPRLSRRDFLVRGGLAVGAVSAAGGGGYLAAREVWDGAEEAAAEVGPREFELEPGYVHLTTFLLAPHPRAVRQAIAEHRRALDADPKRYLFERELELEQRVLDAAARYLGAKADEIALTDSTTMGLGLVYGTLGLGAGDEIVTTEHDHYATHESLRLRAARTGTRVHKIPLYRELAWVSADEIVESVVRAVRPRTRAVAVTWVHSSTGLKLPIRALADALEEENARRDEDERVLLCVDGVHGLGVEDVAVAELGCDVFVSGCHKWLFGPRGTGLVWATPAAWRRVAPVIPTFDARSYVAWIEGRAPSDLPPAAAMTPGGFHSFEHRWALAEAFDLHERIGRREVAARTHALARRLKEGLDSLPRVTLRTPLDDELSAGIVCFSIERMPPRQAAEELERRHKIVASVTPYAEEFVRLGPSVVNSEADVDRAVEAVRSLG